MLEHDSERLRHLVDSLTQRKRAAGLDGAGLEALAEACFRVAVHALTPPEEAIELLERAVRTDGANPKYPYHLARIYFSCGALDQAAEWLESASRLAPSSHRIWTHLSALQRELNLRYREDERFEKHALQERSTALATLVRQGADHVDPTLLGVQPPISKAFLEKKARAQGGRSGGASLEDTRASAPRGPETSQKRRPRLMAAGRCRWSGAVDFLAEGLLEAGPTRDLQRELLPLLEEALAAAGRRRGGAAGFALLALEWLLRGYPVGTIRRLLEHRPPGSEPAAWDLLESTCEIFEAPDLEEVPRRIAQELEAARIPPLLGALIHHRKLLWPKMRFSSLGIAYRAAKRFVADAERVTPGTAQRMALEPDATFHLERLKAVASELVSAPPPEIREEAGDRTAGLEASTAPTVLAALEGWAAELESLRIRALVFLRDDLVPRATQPADGEGRLQQAADANGVRLFLDRLHVNVKQSLERREQVRQAVGQGAQQGTAEALLSRLESLKGKLTRLNPGAFGHPLQTVERALQNQAPGVAAAGPGPEVEALLTAIARAPAELLQEAPACLDAAPPPSGPGAGSPPPERTEAPGTASPPTADPVVSVAVALSRIDKQVDQLFERAESSFRAYPAEILALAPFQALALSVRGRHAEARFKLGQVARARRLWIAFAEQVPFHRGVRNNVALCDTVLGDFAGQASSWRAFLETLYLEDLAVGIPQPGARDRAAFHRAFAGALAPPAVLDGSPPSEKVDAPSLLKFLGSRARLRQFVNHTLLEALNARLEFTSPLLILGVDRNAGPETQARAKRLMLEYVDRVAPLLPERIREPFAALARSRIQRAHEASESARRLTQEKDPSFSREKDQFLGWLKHVVELKFRLFRAIRPHRDAALELTCHDWLGELRRLDRIPLDTSRAFLGQVASAYGDPELFPDLLLSQIAEPLVDALSKRGELARVYEFLLLEVESDVRRVYLVHATLAAAADQAKQGKTRSGHARLFAAVAGWLERARPGLDASGDGEGVSASDLAEIRRAFHHAMAAIFAAPCGGLEARTENARELVDAMTELSEAYPEVEAAYYHRLFGRVELANQAQGAASRVAEEQVDDALARTREAARQLELAGDDARWLIEQGTDAELGAQARELGGQLAARLGGVRVNGLALELGAIIASAAGGIRERSQHRDIARRLDELHQKATALRSAGVADQAGEALHQIIEAIEAHQQQLAEVERSFRR